MTRPTLPLAGKAALVTGGSRGIGAAIVRRLAADGAAVAFTYASSPAKAEALVAELAQAGGKALALQADSADPAAVAVAVDAAARELGQLDILVNNAGILGLGSVETFPIADFDRMYAINVRAPFVAAQAAARHMGHGGRIVIIGSVSGELSRFPGSSAYSTTKAALRGMVRGMAVDLGARGITVNNVQPGPTETDMNPADAPHHGALIGMLPVRRLGRAEEIAGMVAYLAGPEAAFITGASLTIDGGYLA